jgi:hypothetical protein
LPPRVSSMRERRVERFCSARVVDPSYATTMEEIAGNLEQEGRIYLAPYGLGTVLVNIKVIKDEKMRRAPFVGIIDADPELLERLEFEVNGTRA